MLPVNMVAEEFPCTKIHGVPLLALGCLGHVITRHHSQIS
jgi:hypothetical protein